MESGMTSPSIIVVGDSLNLRVPVFYLPWLRLLCYDRNLIFVVQLKTKRKLVPKTVVMGGDKETGYLDVRGSCSGNVVEGDLPFASLDNQLACSVVGIVNDRQTVANGSKDVFLVANDRGVGIVSDRQTVSVDSRDLSVTADVLHDVYAGDGGIRIVNGRQTDESGALLYENQKRSRAAIFTGNNVDGSGGPSSKRQHMSFDHGNQQFGNLTNDTIVDRDFVGATGTSFVLRASGQNNQSHELGASSGRGQN
nr:hypothetical protein [Tanacetum cinerariifolium]